ncbi:MAG: glycosyltransferase, partial [Actinomycetota bacterium]
MKVVIAAGGTAGHVNPGVALAEALGGADITFVGTARGPEAKLVVAAGYS